ncbi:hypothetical protein ACFOMD_17495 [Sphingoaurantiacus capsulatus]|uniref:Lipoprotein n=1 Tax=Sphingoaurantiacus capsulatus TaxID=1771310 RepID=A0ABV7XEK6_9SPHN
MTRAVALLLPLLLPACAAAVVPIPLPAPAPKTQSFTVIGRAPAEVAAMFGKPALDRTEGTARQLQFANANCVLDVYFYPDKRSGKVAATYAEARTPAGQASETAACIDGLTLRS